jgi:predicted dehydrogenase
MKILIVGGGRMGLMRAGFLSAREACEVFLVEPDENTRSRFLQQVPNARPLSFIGEASAFGVDAAIICSPPANHFDSALLCLKIGLPILLEKPSTLTREDSEVLALTAREKRVSISVGYHNRMRASVLKMKELIMGTTVVGFTAWWTCGAYARDWWHDPLLSGGALLEQACHPVDLINFLVGPIVNCGGKVLHNLGAPETGAFWLQSSIGIGGTLFYSSECPQKDIAVRVFTRTGTMHLDGWDLDLSIDGKRVGRGTKNSDRNEVFAHECTEFLKMVRTGASNSRLATLEEAIATENIVRKLKI